MDERTVVDLIFGALAALIGWIVKGIKDDIVEQKIVSRDLANKVQDIEVLVAGDYVKHTDLKTLGDTIFRKLDRIETKLDSKVDK